MNWREKIDEWKNRKRDGEDRKKSEEDVRLAQAVITEAETRRKEMASRFAKWQKQFACNICKSLPQKPTQKSIEDEVSMMGCPVVVGEHYENDWSRPENFYRCEICNHWTCAEHIHNGICLKCSKKL